MIKEWFVFKGTHHLGPFSLLEMEASYRQKEITSQTLIWKEGSEKWLPLSKAQGFKHLFEPEPEAKSKNENLPPLPADEDEDFPPPVPLDVLIDSKGTQKLEKKGKKKKKGDEKFLSRVLFILIFLGFIGILANYFFSEKKSDIQFKLKGIMPIYLEKLEMVALKKGPHLEVEMALSLDGKTLWASSNYGGEWTSVIKMDSTPHRVLGNEEVSILLKGQFKNHLAVFDRMVLSKGTKFLFGEYAINVEGRHTHFINRHFVKLAGLSFFRNLNQVYLYKTKALIYPGTPREFEKKILEFNLEVQNELLKPYQEKLERIRTLESILNSTSQSYLLELEKATSGKAMLSFEKHFVKEISPVLQSIVFKAQELADDLKFQTKERPELGAYKEQLKLGKDIGELASDMITTTAKIKKITEKNKLEMKSLFEERARNIKLQIDLNIKLLEEKIQKI